MGLNATRTVTRAAWLALALAVAGAARDGALWWQEHRLADRIAAVGEVPARADDPPALRLARAAWFAEHEQVDAALSAYRSLHGDAELGGVARYNAANLLMRQALRLRASADPGQAVTLIELAKQGYRELLRIDPGHWDARYNFERAQRLLPDPEDADPPIFEPRNDAERAPTTMRGVAPGLP